MEIEGNDTIKHPQMRSRRFPVESMSIGIVGCPRPDKNFDGRIFLERISKTYTIKKTRIRNLVMMFTSIQK